MTDESRLHVPSAMPSTRFQKRGIIAFPENQIAMQLIAERQVCIHNN